MPARIIDQKKARRSLLEDRQFNHPEADVVARRYLDRLIAITTEKIEQQISYIDILRLQITLGLEALANGFPHLPASPDEKEVRDSLKKALTKQARELGRLPHVSHENVEHGNLMAILNEAAIRRFNRDYTLSYGEVIETDPGCILGVLTTHWLH